MSTNFPTTLDSYTDITCATTDDPKTVVNNLQDAMEAVEAKVGVDSSAVTSSHSYKLSGVADGDKAMSLTGTETLTNKTIILKQGTNPTPTAEGDIQWDTNDNQLKVGDGAATKTFSDDTATVVHGATGAVVGTTNTQTLTNKLLSTGTTFANDIVPAAAIDFSTGIWWEELGRTTLSGAGDTISVTGLQAKKYLRILVYVTATGGTVSLNLRFNNDSGGNYARRSSTNGAAESTAVSQTSSLITGITGALEQSAVVDVHANVAAQEKLFTSHGMEIGAAGAATAPNRSEHTGKWANIADQITRVDIMNVSGTGDFATGSEVIVLGHN